MREPSHPIFKIEEGGIKIINTEYKSNNDESRSELGLDPKYLLNKSSVLWKIHLKSFERCDIARGTKNKIKNLINNYDKQICKNENIIVRMWSQESDPRIQESEVILDKIKEELREGLLNA